MAVLDGSIVIIALPAIFRGIQLDPLAPGNIAYLLDDHGLPARPGRVRGRSGPAGRHVGRVRIYNAGFVVFTFASILLSFDPFLGPRRPLWLIGWRFVQAIGGSMLMANSAAILTDAFPKHQRVSRWHQPGGRAVGPVHRAGGWRLVGCLGLARRVPGQRSGRRLGTIWAYRRLREVGQRSGGRTDRWGNRTFAVVSARCSLRSPSGSSPITATPWAGPVPRCWPFGRRRWRSSPRSS